MTQTELKPATQGARAAAAPAERAPSQQGLQVRGLGVDLGGRSVLRDLDLDAPLGELVALIGPNGAGKTTALRSILGLVPTRAGTVTVQGSAARKSRRRIGYVPQRHEFAWDFPISIENVVLSGRIGVMGWLRRPRVEDFKAVTAALQRVGLYHLRTRPVGELSGGQRQRVLVARALALRPRLLLLDEPFTGLDIPSQELLTDLFQELAAEGHAIVMTTHDLAGAMHLADRLYLINRTVIATGRPDELRQREIWVRAFGFRPDSPLLDALGATC